MSAEILPGNSPNGRSFSQKAGDWLFQQGVSTVLLGFIAIGAWYGIPAAVTKITEELRDQRADYKAQVKDLGDTFKWALDRVAPGAPRLIPNGGD